MLHPERINDPLTFFDNFFQHYQKAEANSGNSISFFYCIGNFKIKLIFAGIKLIPYITRALNHLTAEPFINADLTIFLWDSFSTNIMMPPPPWQIEDYEKEGLIKGFNNERFNTIFRSTSIGLSMIDKERNLAIYWVKDPNTIPYGEIAAPLRYIFHFWMGKNQIQLCHAGAVGNENGGVLLVGKGGSGKSTTALACLESELFYVSDDYCLVQSKPIPKVFSIYSTGKKNADDIKRLPFLKNMISNQENLDREKALYFLYEHFPNKILSNLPLKAILIPKITGKKETTLTLASSMAGLTALAPSSLFLVPNNRQESLKRMGELVKKIPCYYLNLGTNVKQISKIISSIQ
ncbi:hypothetical protein GM3708_3493 [Geminocystis sp. NIES-3708]|uniref:hypothetical protein n=1 Tax=Geminocystis sp. NIES-3708 TaxID=1615909 RepID=UPI0005FC62E3|nr:hypothetical protein [Geminocystis sp. NIES-3708]BAQ63087.1 hypothetical protein GM3708_3493 [Geminocystis sp. NIES-3708]